MSYVLEKAEYSENLMSLGLLMGMQSYCALGILLRIRREFPRDLRSPLRNCHKSINFVVCRLYLKNLESVGKRI